MYLETGTRIYLYVPCNEVMGIHENAQGKRSNFQKILYFINMTGVANLRKIYFIVTNIGTISPVEILFFISDRGYHHANTRPHQTPLGTHPHPGVVNSNITLQTTASPNIEQR